MSKLDEVKVDEQQMDLMDDLLKGLGGGTEEVSFDEPEESVEDLDIETKEEEIEDVSAETKENNKDETIVEDVEETDLNALNEQLRLQLAEMAEKLSYPTESKVKENVTGEEETKIEGDPEKILEQFLTAEELDRVIDEPQLLNVAFSRAIQAFQQSNQNLRGNISTLVQEEIKRQRIIDEAVSSFYNTNQDLRPYAKFVQYTMAEMEKTMKDKPYSEIFVETAKECRKRLGLKPLGLQVAKGDKPAFAGSRRSSGARPSGKPAMFDENAADMLNLT